MTRLRILLRSFCAIFVLAACVPIPAQAQTWEVVAQPGGQLVARGTTVSGAGLVQGIGLTCERNVPIIALGLVRVPSRNPALLSLSDGRSTGKLGIVRNRASNVWAGPVRDTRVLDMLARSTSVNVAIDGAPFGVVSLAGAGEAMRGALGKCYTGAVASVAGEAPIAIATPAASTAGAAATAGKLEAGVYLPATMKCSEMDWMTRFGNLPDDEPAPIDIGQNRERDRALMPSVRVTSRTSFIYEKVRYTLCPARDLRPDAELWPEDKIRSLSALPIKPGLYRIYAGGKPIPKGERCGISAEYLLFEPARVAMVAEESVLDRNGYPTSKFTKARKVESLGRRWQQIGKRIFETVYIEGQDALFSGPWRIEAPDRFEVYNGECDVIQFRPVDPRTVPPALMPRF